MKPKQITFFALVVCISALISSCSTSRTNLSYFTDLRQLGEGEMTVAGSPVKIEPNDEIFISVTSMVPEATAMYNLPVANPATNKEVLNAANARQQTYLVSKDGDINFPQFGKIHVEGLTTHELADRLEALIGKEVEDPTVKVTLMNFTVNVMGEVRHPGRIKVENERFTIIDAIASAGDLTEYGKRDNVLLIRDNNGSLEYHNINLNDKSIFSSPYYYLKQNDVLVIDPNDIRKANARYNTQNSYRLQVISSIISASSVIASLVIALTVK